MRKPEPHKLPRFASRRDQPCQEPPWPEPPGPKAPGRAPAPPPPRFAKALEVLHKLLTGGAALGAILRLFF